MKTEYVLGVKVNTEIKLQDVVKEVDRLIKKEGSHLISTTNAEFVMDAQKDKSFKEIINNSALSIPDGIGVLYALYYEKLIQNMKKGFLFPVKAFIKGVWFGVTSLFVKYPLGERVSGVELMYELCDYAAKNNKTVYLLGGWAKNKLGRNISRDINVASITASKLRKKYPKLLIVGAESQFTHKIQDDTVSIKYIHNDMKVSNVNHIDLLFVAYGHPAQEKWIVRNGTAIPAKVCIGVGGTFDYISRIQKRSPQIFISLNLEWLYKLVTQPWRFTRIFKAFPTFPFTVFLYSIRKS
jgi:N-acetylglucosaminyldiphosphoundecaprenol N-acetyl-beta-D-mannosaminyltransferase